MEKVSWKFCGSPALLGQYLFVFGTDCHPASLPLASWRTTTGKLHGRSIADVDHRMMVDAIEVDLKHTVAIGHRRRGQATRRRGEGDAPPVA